MRMLQQLAGHLKDHTGLKRENIHAFADNGELVISGADLGLGYEVARFKYDAVINIERYPGSAMDITAMVAGWLMDNDHSREELRLADPGVSAEINDNDTADVEIVVEFNESIQVVEDPAGNIQAWGKRWRVAEVAIDTATALVNMEGSTDGE